MATTTNIWYHDLNRDDSNPLTAAAPTTQTEQYQNACFNLKRALIGVAPAVATGAWSVHSTCDGTTVNPSGDNWTSPASITFAAAGSAHSWIVFQNATLMSGGTVYLIMDCTNVAGDTYPTDVVWYLARTAPTGGLTTARPTSTTQTAALRATGRVLYNTAAFNPVTFHFWRNSRGEFVWISSEDGTGHPDCALVIAAPQGGSNTLYNVIGYCYYQNSTGGGLAWNILGGNAQWQGWSSLGTVCNYTLSSPASNMLNWTNGSDEVGARYSAYIDGVNTSASTATYVGQFVDIRATSNNTPSNTDFLPDSDPIIMKSLGSLLLPTPTSTGLIL